MGIGDWGLGIGDWGLGIGPHPLGKREGPHMDSVTLRKTHFKLGDYVNPYQTSNMEQSRNIQSAGYRAVSLDQNVKNELRKSHFIFGNNEPNYNTTSNQTYYDKTKIFNASTCGDNCAEWILRISEDRKTVINLRHLMDFGKGEFKIKVMNTGKVVKNMQELVSEAGEFV